MLTLDFTFHWLDKPLSMIYAHPFIVNIFISICGFWGLLKMIPTASQHLLARGLGGIDLNKKRDPDNPKKIPEGLGLVVGAGFLICIIVFELFNQDRSYMPQIHTALLAICFMLLLGFADDVLVFRWRSKIAMSLVAAIPLACYYGGPTAVMVPFQLRPWFGKVLELGYFYKLYVGAFAVFCTNGINIYAGINGLEVSQSMVVGGSIVIHAVYQICRGNFVPQNRFAFFMCVPFVFCSGALFHYNKFPSRVFVGDSFTYMAGMTIGAVASLAHITKTVMLFMAPQILNFLLSLPQLLGLPRFLHGIVPVEFRTCPRHRLPKLNEETGKLEATKNLNLINFTLWLFGPMTEKQLLHLLTAMHIVWCGVAFAIRFWLAGFFYEKVR